MKPNPGEKFDVVIIGSGLGGLVCGAILSKEGKKVCIVEKNEQIGGNLQTFTREGVKFDTGVHYLGGLDKGQNLYSFFNYLEIMDRLKLEKMDVDGFDIIVFKDDKQEYSYGMGYERFIKQLSERFPEEKQAIFEYCNEIKRVCDSVPLYNLRNGEFYPDPGIFTISAKQYIESLTHNKKLQSVLAGNNLLYAGIGDKSPFYVHALVVNSYIESSYRCATGSDQIAKLLAKEIIRNNGMILRKRKVVKIHVEDKNAQFVQLEDGMKIYGENFISNIHPVQTLNLLDTDQIRPVYRKRIKSLDNSISVFAIYVILKPGTVEYKNRNYYYFEKNDVWNCSYYTPDTWPTSYALFECVPKHQKKFVEAISILTYMHIDDVKAWAHTSNTATNKNERGEDYKEFKKRKAEKLLETVALKFPDLRNHIQSYYSSTPLSYRDYIGTDDGTAYGIIKDFNDPLKTIISTKTRVPNLLLTGQNLHLHGVLGVTVSAVITCSALLGKKYLLNKILEANEMVN